MSSRSLALLLAGLCFAGFAQAASPVGEALYAAIYNGDPVAVQAALQRDPAVVSQVSSGGLLPLHYAARLGRFEIAYRLLKAGADVGAIVATSKTTPLHWAAGQNDADMVRLFLEHGADVEARAANGFTPLHLAARNGTVASLSALLRAHANVDALDADGNTPLHLAVASNREAAASHLLAGGANAQIRNAKGERPADLAKGRKIAKLFASRSSPGSKPVTKTNDAAHKPRAVAPAKPQKPARKKPALDPLQPLPIPEGGLRTPPRSGKAIVFLNRTGTERYEGQFADFLRSGDGVYHYAAGHRLSCRWEHDVPHGFGTFLFADGGRVEGIWSHGRFLNGVGVFLNADGERLTGVWKDGELVSFSDN